MSLELTPFSVGGEEDAAYVHYHRQTFPWLNLSVDRHRARSAVVPPAAERQPYLLREGGKVVGSAYTATMYWSAVAGSHTWELFSDPDPAFDPLEAVALLEAALAHHQPRHFCTFANDNHLLSRVLLENDYRESLRLSVQRFDLQTWSPQIAEQQSPYRLASVAELEAEGFDWKFAMHELINTVVHDVPMSEPVLDEPYDEFLQRIEDNQLYPKASIFVAIEGETLVGLTELVPQASPSTTWTTMLSGVRREHRRRGVVSALKRHALAHAKSQGATEVVTENEIGNPMRAINEHIGFQHFCHYLELTKDTKQ